MACCCSLSRQTVRHLKVNTPHWPVIVGLRLVTALVACSIIAAFVVCITAPTSVVIVGGNGGSSNAWQWGDIWMESFAFVPPAVSLLQTLVTISYLLSTTHLPHPGFEIVFELTIILVTAFPIIFCASVSGPLQQWQHPNSEIAPLELYGIMELVGFIGLCLLVVFHVGFLVLACCRAHQRRREKIMRSRAAAMKLEAGWGIEEEDDYLVRLGGTETQDEIPQLLKESTRPIEDAKVPLGGAGLGLAARKESTQAETLNSARLPSTVSALSAWDGELSPGDRRPSSLELMPLPRGRKGTDASQIGVAIGKEHEIWVPITELRSESPFSVHRVIPEHEVVIVGDGEVKVVSTPREEVFMGFKLPEPSTPRLDTERKGSEVSTIAPPQQNPDPDIPPPLKVKKSMQRTRSFKFGNSWEMKESKPRLSMLDQGW